ncbi:MAG: PQQ-binding-like beta-propeller repeat protein [Thermoanaerobaculia bacterium]
MSLTRQRALVPLRLEPRIALTVAAVAVSLAAPLAVPLPAENWPQWRGQGRNGQSPETGLALAWSEDGPPLAWQRPAGQGFSSVASVDGRLYTAWASGDQELVVALDADGGQELWSTSIGPLYENQRGGGPRSTPTVDGDRLFVQGAAGRLAAVALANGELLWSRDLVAELGAEVPIWGFSASPLVVGELVIVPVGGEGQAVAAFHRSDGRLLWSAHDDAASYSSAVLAELAGREQIVVLTGQSVSGFSLDGEVHWTHPWPVINNINVATPLAIDGRHVFVSTSYDVGAVLLEIKEGNGRLQAIEVWRDRVMKSHFQGSVRRGDHLYGFDNAFLKCIEIATGEQLWAHRGFGKGQLVLVGDRMIVLGERGALAVVQATPEGYRELAAARLPTQRYWTPPTLADGRLYVRTESDLFAFALDRAPAESTERGGVASTEATGPLTIGELIKRNLAARGTEEAWARAAAIRASGRMNLNGRESELTVWRAADDRIRWEVRFLDREELFVHGGESAWFKSIRADEGGLVADARLAELLDLADSYLPPRDPWSALGEIHYAGPDRSAGEQHTIEVVVRGKRQQWRLSPDGFQLVEARRGDDEDPITAFLLDWRSVEGVVLPHYVEVSFGTAMYSVQWDEVEVLRDVREGLFKVPES